LVGIFHSLSTDVTNNLIGIILFFQAHVEITKYVTSVTNTSQYQSQFEHIVGFDNVNKNRIEFWQAVIIVSIHLYGGKDGGKVRQIYFSSTSYADASEGG
jgi:hypothetical protein